MEISGHDALAVVHGMLFGALFIIGLSGAFLIVHATSAAPNPWVPTNAQRRLLAIYLTVLAALGWCAVLIGAYVVYPWYRAIPPAGAANLRDYPQFFLLSSPVTAGWHERGMEWKEHIAWFAPMSLTAVASIFARHGAHPGMLRAMRRPMLSLVAFAFACACIAGFFGAMLNKHAPLHGGGTVVILSPHAHD